jgi:hypothetical protein
MVISIEINNETKSLIKSFRIKGESYDKTIRRIYYMAIKTQLREFRESSKHTISINEARKELGKRWKN